MRSQGIIQKQQKKKKYIKKDIEKLSEIIYTPTKTRTGPWEEDESGKTQIHL